jgi:hypothetical protein
MDEFSVHPETLAGDGFAYAAGDVEPPHEASEVPHACIDGWVYIGHIVIDEDGEEVEVIEQMKCRRCVISEHHSRL